MGGATGGGAVGDHGGLSSRSKYPGTQSIETTPVQQTSAAKDRTRAVRQSASLDTVVSSSAHERTFSCFMPR